MQQSVLVFGAVSCHHRHSQSNFELSVWRSPPLALQVCLYSVMCKNGASLWEIGAGQDWHCALSNDGYRLVRNAIDPSLR